MARFVTTAEIDRLRSAAPDSLQAKLYASLRTRVQMHTRYPGLIQPDEDNGWWHVCEGRCGDAAFVWHVERDEKLGEWIRDAALWMSGREDDDWIGPWFRNHERPLVGTLETGHICRALCEILDLCPELFTAEEIAGMEENLKWKGMDACRRFCEKTMRQHGHINNWFNMVLSGYGACALYFGDEEAIRQCAAWMPICTALFNRDSYGETVHYANYAASNIAYLNEIMLRFRPDLKSHIDMASYGRMHPWYAASLLYMKPWSDEIIYPRSINFADSAAMFRPSGDILAQIAVRMKDELPEEAALATWLLETTYAPSLSDDPSVIRRVGRHCNQYRFYTVLMQPDMAPAKSPEELNLPLSRCFENGHYIMRDAWHNPRTVLAVQAGYQPLNVTSHRHQDSGSFQLTQGRERMIVDAGSCCYRLKAFRFCCSSIQHSVFDFLDEVPTPGFGMPRDPYAGVHPQLLVDGNCFEQKPPRIVNRMDETIGGAHVLSLDLTDSYGEEVALARRAFVSVLPGALFLIDRAETGDPLRMRTHFPLNNRDGALRARRVDEHRYVFCRRGEGMKLFECTAFVDGEPLPSRMQLDWGYVHQNTHTPANQPGQAKEGSAQIYNWVDAAPGRSHLRLCAIASDVEGRIDGWRIMQDENGCWFIETPEKQRLITIRLTKDHAYLVHDGQETELV